MTHLTAMDSPSDEFLGEPITEFQRETIARDGEESLVVGTYVLVDQIGSGGMGAVYRARDRRDSRAVAVKTLNIDARDQEVASRRFQREFRILQGIDHPNLAKALDVIEAHGKRWIVMEYVEGIDIRQRMNRHGKPDLRTAVGWIVQAARGLEHAHAQGIIHRDIKPANLIVSPEDSVTVVDFGVARVGDSLFGGDTEMHTLTATGQAIGTGDFMAPEQATGDRKIDHRADVYSLGCTLYFLIHGQPPYARETIVETLLAHLEADIPSLDVDSNSDDRRALQRVYSKMVAKQPDQRYASMSDVADELTAFLDGLPQAKLLVRKQAMVISLMAVLMCIGLWLCRVKLQSAMHVPSVADVSAQLISTTSADADHTPRGVIQGTVNADRATIVDMLGVFPYPVAMPDGSSWQIVSKFPHKQVRASGWSGDGTQVYVAMRRGQLRCYDFSTREMIWIKQIHGHAIDVIRAQPAGSLIATAHADFVVRLWDDAFQLQRELRGHSARIEQIAWNSDGTSFATRSVDGLIRIWNEQGEPGPVLSLGTKIYDMGWHPDGQRIAAVIGTALTIWEPGSGTRRTLVPADGGSITSVSWSPDGQSLACGLATSEVRLITPDDGQTMVRMMKPADSRNAGPVKLVRWSPNGQCIASIDHQNIWWVNLWTPDGKRISNIQAWPASMQWNLDGSFLYLQDQFRERFHSPIGETLMLLKPKRRITGVTSLDFSAVGNHFLSSSNDATVRSWSVDGHSLRTFDFDPRRGRNTFTSRLPSVYANPTNAWFACSSYFDGNYVRDERNMPLLYLPIAKANSSLAWHPDGQRLTVESDDNVIEIYRMDGSKVATLAGIDTSELRWNSQGDRLCAVGRDPAMRIWDDSGRLIATPNLGLGFVRSVDWDPDGSRFAITVDNQNVQILDADGNPIKTLGVQGGHVRWNPRGGSIATANNDVLMVWSIERDELICQFPTMHNGQYLESTALAWDASGKLLLVAGPDGLIHAWNIDQLQIAWVAWVFDQSHHVTFDRHGRVIDGDPRALFGETLVAIRRANGELEYEETETFFANNGFAMSPVDAEKQ